MKQKLQGSHKLQISHGLEGTVTWPVRCVTCGQGEVIPMTSNGRTARYRNMLALPIPDDLAIPTCRACGAEWIDRSTARALDEALEAEYQKRLRELLLADLKRLAERQVTQQRLEGVLGLSQGYLSKIRSGASRPSPTLVGCLHLLAADPEHRLREMEESLEP